MFLSRCRPTLLYAEEPHYHLLSDTTTEEGGQGIHTYLHTIHNGAHSPSRPAQSSNEHRRRRVSITKSHVRPRLARSPFPDDFFIFHLPFHSDFGRSKCLRSKRLTPTTVFLLFRLPLLPSSCFLFCRHLPTGGFRKSPASARSISLLQLLSSPPLSSPLPSL